MCIFVRYMYVDDAMSKLWAVIGNDTRDSWLLDRDSVRASTVTSCNDHCSKFSFTNKINFPIDVQ